MLLIIAEENDRRVQQTRATFFDDARGSEGESAACLDALVAKRVCRRERVQSGKQMLERVVSMLKNGLIGSIDIRPPPRIARLRGRGRARIKAKARFHAKLYVVAAEGRAKFVAPLRCKLTVTYVFSDDL